MPRTRRANPRITIFDVARMAGVSPSTVSNFLHGRTHTMTAETMQRVQRAIHRLKYHPSSTARGLATSRTATIGLVLAEIETPLFLQALSTIEPIARGAGYNILLCTARSTEDERQALNLLLEKEAEGIILLSTSEYHNDDHLAELQEMGMPVVLVNRSKTYDYFDQINWDNAGGIGSLVDHLARLGHHRIAHLRGPEKRRSSMERLEGYRQALERNQLNYREEYVRSGDYAAPQEAWHQSTIELLNLSPRPTAIIGSDDIVAATVMQTVQRTGLRVPEDIAVVGIDDQPFCTYLNPPLTTIRLPVIEAGKRAVEMLLDWIVGTRTATEHILLPCPLVTRESCGAGLTSQSHKSGVLS